jgi:hypothetical protein
MCQPKALEITKEIGIQGSNTIKVLVSYLETKENELTAEYTVCIKPQIEQLKA